ncbi:MAG: hypothetical protein GY794_09200 [bacterium]|nr:hypothetical protein [bacterium]
MGLSNNNLGRSALLCAMVLVAHVAILGAVTTAPVLLDGFEKAFATEPEAKVKTITSGPGLTEGKSAAELSPGGKITVKVRGADISKLPWLRIDTHHTGDGTRSLNIKVALDDFKHNVQGYVQTGKDTLAFPLTMVIEQASSKPDNRVFTITITNSDDIPIVVDNLRLEPLVRKPKDAVFWDFGRVDSQVWPGFTRQSAKSKNINLKSGSNYTLRYPDPLTRDFIGPSLGNNEKVPVTITAPKPISMAAWVWLTHYGKRYYQPQEYMCRATRGRPIGKKLSQSQLMGRYGLLEGAGGLWTPQWYAKDYANHFVTLMPFSITKGKAVIELGNCQIAAIVMVPSVNRLAMATSIKLIQGELARFRRQFVMKHLKRNPCQLEPTEGEKKLGLMLFRPPADEAFTGSWKPRADQRIRAMHKISQPGGTIRIPLAFVPLQRKSMMFRVTPGSLRSDSGSTLLLNRNSFQVNHMQLVPAVRKGITTRRPWLMVAKSPTVEVGDIGYLWLTATIPPRAKKGLYRGTWKLGSGSARISIPVEIEIADCGHQDTKDLTIISHALPHASTVYGTALSPTSKKTIPHKLDREVFKQVSKTGINAYTLPGPVITASSKSPSSWSIQRALDKFPLKELDSPVFIDISRTLSSLRWGRGSKNKGRANEVIALANSLCSKYSIKKRYFYFGHSSELANKDGSTGLKTRLDGAKRFASGNCRVVIYTQSSTLTELSTAEFKTKLKPVSALILNPDSSSLVSQIAAFKKLGSTKKVYLQTSRTDRFTMGFYAAIVQADGCLISSVFMDGGPYNGYYINGHGLIAPNTGGKLAQTVSAFRIKQARDDWNLIRQARSLVARATTEKVTAREVSDVLSEIRTRAESLKTLTYYHTRFATTAVSQAEMDSWTTSLLNALSIVNGRLAASNERK